MLKGIDPLLGPDLLRILRAMGHGDEIAIVDGNYPADTDAQRLVRMDGHDAPRIVDAILSVMPIDEFVPEAVFRPAAYGDTKRMEPVFSDFETVLKKYEPKQKISVLVGSDFYNRVKACYAIVASGERRLYGNLILRKGIIHPLPLVLAREAGEEGIQSQSDWGSDGTWSAKRPHLSHFTS